MSRSVKNRNSTPPYVKDDAVEPMKGLVIGDTEIAQYLNDFLVGQDYAAADWVITTVEDGAGSATEAISVSERSGALVLTTDDGAVDSTQLQASIGATVAEIWQLQSDKRLVIAAKFKVGDITDSVALLGICITDTSLLGGMTDGVYFRKADLDATLQAVTEKDSAEDTLDITEMVNDIYVEVAMAWDGKGSIEVFLLSSGTWTSIGVLDTAASHPTDEALAVSLAILNGAAAAKTLTIDYIRVIQER